MSGSRPSPTPRSSCVDGRDPLYSRWQYGLGRAAVFASDAKARWAADWITWKGYDKFWVNVCRDLAAARESQRRAPGIRCIVRRSCRALSPGRERGRISCDPQSLCHRPRSLSASAHGKENGARHLRWPRGDRRPRRTISASVPVDDSAAFPEAALYRPEAELAEVGSDEVLLKQVAEFTGGRYQPAASDVFDSGGRTVACDVRFMALAAGAGDCIELVRAVICGSRDRTDCFREHSAGRIYYAG